MAQSLRRSAANGLGRIFDELLPGRCLLCGGDDGRRTRGEEHAGLCAPCSDSLPRLRQACAQCALPGPFEGGPCGRCLRKPPAFATATAALLYDYPVDRLVQRFKFTRCMAAGAVLGAELSAAVRDPGICQRVDLLLPVPLHFSRRISRGFNQSELLARQVGRALGLPVRADVLRRRRRTRPQAGLDLAGRSRNLRRAFRCANLAGLRVALVDDVLTTGTTLDECARTLLSAGAAAVSVWVAARVPPPHAPHG